MVKIDDIYIIIYIYIHISGSVLKYQGLSMHTYIHIWINWQASLFQLIGPWEILKDDSKHVIFKHHFL